MAGTVRDTSGSSVPGAQVELRGKSYSATASTDTSGSFIFDNVTDTSGTIVVRANGFQEVQHLWAASSGVPLQLDIDLLPLGVKQRILVTAARTPTPLGETPVSDIQLTKEDVEATPACSCGGRFQASAFSDGRAAEVQIQQRREFHFAD